MTILTGPERPGLAQEVDMSTALVAIVPTPQPATILAASRPASAAFLAHLIATARQVPQTRARRRAAPAEAIEAYAAVGQRPIRSGRVLSRSL
jgi:hypothetical protein